VLVLLIVRDSGVGIRSCLVMLAACAVELNLGVDTIQSVRFSVASIVAHNTLVATIWRVLWKTKAIHYHEEKTRRHRLEGPWRPKAESDGEAAPWRSLGKGGKDISEPTEFV